MIAKRDWLWDRNTSLERARSALKNPKDKFFLSLAALLLSRKNTPKEVFGIYIKPLVFLQNWQRIKRQMRKDTWNNPRIEFWQAIYEKLKEKYENKGISISKETAVSRPQDEFCKLIADKIKAIRKLKGLTQIALAKKLKISQQLISRIERGRENISLLTLKKIVDGLGAEIHLEIAERIGI
jgi:DNA-binding XRE family transcriptional regulator